MADKQRPGTDTTPHGLDGSTVIAGESDAVEREDDEEAPDDGGTP